MQNVLARGDGPASALPGIAILLGAAAVLTLISSGCPLGSDLARIT